MSRSGEGVSCIGLGLLFIGSLLGGIGEVGKAILPFSSGSIEQVESPSIPARDGVEQSHQQDIARGTFEDSSLSTQKSETTVQSKKEISIVDSADSIPLDEERLKQLVYQRLVFRPPIGSIFMFVVGFLGVSYLAVKLKGVGNWLVLLLGYLADQVLSMIYVLPIISEAVVNPIGIRPSILGTIATFCAGGMVGFFRPGIPIKLAIGIVSVDCFFVGIYGFVTPFPLSPWLVFRITAAFGASMFGGIIGQYLFFAIVRREISIGKLLSRIVFAAASAVITGLITALLLLQFKQ